MKRTILSVALLLALAGCSQPSRPSDEQLASLKPADTHLAALYVQSCKACHANPNSGAPLVHDRAAWDVRWAKGLPTLVDHAIVGFQAMPAGGQCVACTPKDYEGLIRFMADHEGTP
ncbi:MAG: c-type cytochrome [Rhizomicrobium sp.]|jgi:cytochrome c5